MPNKAERIDNYFEFAINYLNASPEERAFLADLWDNYISNDSRRTI